jgi:hypothetical protein
MPGVQSACVAQALSGCPHGARAARRARSPCVAGPRDGGLLRQRGGTRQLPSCSEPRRTESGATGASVEALASGGPGDGPFGRWSPAAATDQNRRRPRGGRGRPRMICRPQYLWSGQLERTFKQDQIRADFPRMSPQQVDCQWCEKSRPDDRSACTGCGGELTPPKW